MGKRRRTRDILCHLLLAATLAAADVLPEYPSSGVRRPERKRLQQGCRRACPRPPSCSPPSPAHDRSATCRPVLPEVPDASSGDTGSVGGSALPAYVPSKQNLELRRWFRAARLGLFIHWGIYANLGRGEWVLHNDRMHLDDYRQLAPRFNPVCAFAAPLRCCRREEATLSCP